jgi:endoglucanase
MTDILPFLKSIISTSGVSGHETPVAKLIAEKWRPLVDEVTTSRVGSLHGLKKGTSPGLSTGSGKGAALSKSKGKRPAIMIATHMDAIGMMVSKVSNGFLHITDVGGIDVRVLPGTPVTVHASSGEELPGVIAMPAAKLLPDSLTAGEVLEINYLLVDTGLTPREVEKKVKVGDLVSFANDPMELAGDVLSGHTLDNRASVAALTVCLEELQGKNHIWDVWAVATVQEETSYLGASSSAYAIRPQIAIAVDGTFAKGPGANGWQTHPMGKGVGLCLGPNMHPFIHKKLTEVADKFEIPWFLDVTTAASGTDAYPMQVIAEGIPTGLVEFPIRYMHTPVESVSVKDIQRAGRLLAEFIASLDADFVEKIVWE